LFLPQFQTFGGADEIGERFNAEHVLDDFISGEWQPLGLARLEKGAQPANDRTRLLVSLTMSARMSRVSVRSGGSCASRRCAAWALVRMIATG
jgi:hypothetical protein